MPTKPSYKSKIVSVIASLGTRGGSSLAAIKKALNAEPKQYRYIITAIDKGVADGTFTKTDGKYKVGKKDTKKVAKNVVKKKVVKKKKVTKKKKAFKKKKATKIKRQRESQAGKLSKYVDAMAGTQSFHVIQLEGAEGLSLSDTGMFNARSAVDVLKEEGLDIDFIRVNLHLLCGGQGYLDDNVRLRPYGMPPNKEDVLAFCQFQHPQNGGFNCLQIGVKSKTLFEEIQSFMDWTPEEHDAQMNHRLNVGHSVVIISSDNDGNAFVDVLAGALNEGIDAFYEFPDAKDVTRIIKKRNIKQ